MSSKLQIPEASSEAIRKTMKANKAKNTKPELIVRRALREEGYPGYRINWKNAPGRPDIAYPGKKLAVFVNGCFWHRCPHCNMPLPKSHIEYWSTKFEMNVERDRRKAAELESLGWTVITIWECELKKDQDEAIARITRHLDDQKEDSEPRSSGCTYR